MSHSSIAGGSTAKRVIACPASVKLVQQMPPKPSSSYADEGTLCHLAMEKLLTEDNFNIYSLSYAGIDMTTELAKEKIEPALAALDEIDPSKSMEFTVEANVSYGDFLPEVFGSVDLIGRLGDRAVILDWKFGSGVSVEVEENEQLMFYAAAAMRTKGLEWVFDGAASIELVIVQPPSVKRWKTTAKRIREFEKTLKKAIDLSETPDAPLASGKHCKWCAAKPTCPLMTGEVDRALQASLDNIDADSIANYLQQAEILEQWITDLRALAFQMLEAGKPVPNYKLVAKRGTRKWTNEAQAVESLLALGLTNDDIYDSKLVSPAQAEKKLKALKLPMPNDVVAVVSSGSTMAHESDPRPTVLLIGQQLTNALNKL